MEKEKQVDTRLTHLIKFHRKNIVAHQQARIFDRLHRHRDTDKMKRRKKKLKSVDLDSEKASPVCCKTSCTTSSCQRKVSRPREEKLVSSPVCCH
ncbi:hypothetical protein NPIL_625951 [Nephila pilipes]|uniref:Uncharacterized protein n=1 Tax=Nephila pilipes TaxID=299642 RepID=A0A8X6PUK4_NEPPI|nr:hypothetical protein NPIL_625951 [Nephila pilipes]